MKKLKQVPVRTKGTHLHHMKSVLRKLQAQKKTRRLRKKGRKERKQQLNGGIRSNSLKFTG